MDNPKPSTRRRLPSRPGPKYRGSNTRGFDPDPAASERLAGFLGTHLPAAGVHGHTATCLYTLTPDRDLVLGPLPGHDRLGRVLADLALQGGTEVDISGFAADRPALTAAELEARYLV